MKILVVGKKFVDYEKKDGSGRSTGYEIKGIITEPDDQDENLEGNDVFSEYMRDPSALTAEINQEYEVIFTMRKFKGEYKAYPGKLVKVTN